MTTAAGPDERLAVQVPAAAVAARRNWLRRGRNRGRKRPPRYSRKARIATYLILAPLAILFVAPFAWLITASFQPLTEIFQKTPSWIPHNPTMAGYKGFLNVGHLTKAQAAAGHGDWRWFANTAKC